jgi:hypothetical protein
MRHHPRTGERRSFQHAHGRCMVPPAVSNISYPYPIPSKAGHGAGRFSNLKIRTITRTSSACVRGCYRPRIIRKTIRKPSEKPRFPGQDVYNAHDGDARSKETLLRDFSFVTSDGKVFPSKTLPSALELLRFQHAHAPTGRV